MHILGIALLLIGIAFLFIGLNASRAITEKILRGFTGQFTQNTRLYLYGGIAFILAGAVLIFFWWQSLV